jgi:hypothetical protein
MSTLQPENLTISFFSLKSDLGTVQKKKLAFSSTASHTRGCNWLPVYQLIAGRTNGKLITQIPVLSLSLNHFQ